MLARGKFSSVWCVRVIVCSFPNITRNTGPLLVRHKPPFFQNEENALLKSLVDNLVRHPHTGTSYTINPHFLSGFHLTDRVQSCCSPHRWSISP